MVWGFVRLLRFLAVVSISIDDFAHDGQHYSHVHPFNMVIAVSSSLVRLNLHLHNIGRVVLGLIDHRHWITGRRRTEWTCLSGHGRLCFLSVITKVESMRMS
jgi:hypothetical protein